MKNVDIFNEETRCFKSKTSKYKFESHEKTEIKENCCRETKFKDISL